MRPPPLAADHQQPGPDAVFQDRIGLIPRPDHARQLQRADHQPIERLCGRPPYLWRTGRQAVRDLPDEFLARGTEGIARFFRMSGDFGR